MSLKRYPLSPFTKQLYFVYLFRVFNSVFSQFILEMMGELYTVQEMPEQPKEGFFKGLFGGGAKLLDREELCES